jgi:cell division protein FtsB
VGQADTKARGPGQSRVERRRQAQARRNRLILVLGVMVSLAVVGAWFPASDLLHQRQQLAQTSSELHQLDGQNRALRHQAKELETPAAVGRIAQQQYDLVKPGEQAYQVLPPSSADGDGTLTTSAARSRTQATASGGSAGAGDVGGTGAAVDARAPASSTSFLGRIVQSLEFWR